MALLKYVDISFFLLLRTFFDTWGKLKITQLSSLYSFSRVEVGIVPQNLLSELFLVQYNVKLLFLSIFAITNKCGIILKVACARSFAFKHLQTC